MSSAGDSPPFDPNTYLEQIVEAFRRTSDNGLPPLIDRYALDGRFIHATDAEIRDRINEVANLWQRQAKMSTRAGIICRTLLAADNELRRTPGYQNPQWWRDQIAVAQPTDSRGEGPAEPPVHAATGDARGSAVEPGQQSEAKVSDAAAEPPPVVLPRPTGLQAEVMDDRVMVRWNEPTGIPTGVTFVVQRSVGTQIRQLRASQSNLSVEDRDPPAGRPLIYRVIASHADTGLRSVSQPLKVVFSPPVLKLSVRQARDGGVVGQWSAHQDLWRARAWRSNGDSSATASDSSELETRHEGFEDSQPPLGLQLYSVIPLYRDPDSGEIHQGPKTAVKVAVLEAPPLPVLVLDGGGQLESSTISVRWGELPAFTTLMLRRTADEPPGAPGNLLMAEEVDEIGELVASGLTGTTAIVSLPPGRWVLIPFAIAGDRAVRGGSKSIDVVPPMTSPEVLRVGPDVKVSWVWPAGMRLARLIWHAEGTDWSREITHNEYQRQGGVAFSRREAATVEIRGIVRSGSEVLMSAPATVKAPAQLPTVTFHAYKVRQLFGFRQSRNRRRMVIVADLPCTCSRLDIYVHAPDASRERDVVVKVMEVVDLGPDSPCDVTIHIPSAKQIERPCYISCRAESAHGVIRVDNFASRGREIS